MLRSEDSQRGSDFICTYRDILNQSNQEQQILADLSHKQGFYVARRCKKMQNLAYSA